MKHRTIGIDLAKNTFYLICLGEGNKLLWRKKLSRSKLKTFFANIEPTSVAMEACSSAHYWARLLEQQGHHVKLLPAQHVKAYLRGQKNDYNDALAIAEASTHASIRPVPVKTIEQQDSQALHRIRHQIKCEQTRIINQLRGLLAEYGITIGVGAARARREVPDILLDEQTDLTPTLKALLNRQYQRLLALVEESDWYDNQLQQEVKTNCSVKALQAVPGFGPVNASALVSWMGHGTQFKRGRDASASLGLVPRQYSTGGKPKLFGITKCGDAYVRTQIIHGARAVVFRAKNKTDRLSLWINRLVETRGHNKAAIALANKLVRIAWVIITRQVEYQPVN